MVRKPFSNPYGNDPLGDDSPVIDPASVYQADPEINFDNVKQAPGMKPQYAEHDHAAKQGGHDTDQAKTILEKLREARAASEAQAAKAASEHGAKAAPEHGAKAAPEHGAKAASEHGEKTAPEECPHCADAEKARLMALADLENARKRLTREKEEFVKFAGESILADILPALDNLDLALAYAPQGKECHNFVVGVDMTRKLLLDALAKHGLQQVGDLGETFDPAKHEAVEMQPHPEYESGQVCGLMNKGYRLKDRLIRPARVKVCKN
ncbi:Protein GrpE (modular protein) [uncultured delta proteobacterium]|uniref:Protein GrpE n=1 Tax=uncultured delta proteobacterium TaxID=34034 RepID=A0A212KCA0_9DELT|nr:Protein GrpE (modular protein) [uncultured delta proteobacterium]